jgi:iron complex transport system substrate-binding protein
VKTHAVKTPALAWAAAVLASSMIMPIAMPCSAGAFTVHDDDGDLLTLQGPAQRIISLAPGATAMLFAAGAGDRIVGTSEFSNEPDAAKQIERVSDAQSINLERILALHPDVVVVWVGGTSPQQIDRLRQAGLPLYHHHISRLDDLPGSLQRLGALAGTGTVAPAAADKLQARVTALRGRYPPRHQQVLIEIWDKPLFTVGRDEVITDIVHACGFQSAYEDLKQVSAAITLESVLKRNPDVVLVLAADAHTMQQWIEQWRQFSPLKAQREGHVLGWSDTRLTGFGPGVIDAAEGLCAMLDRAVPARP